MNGSNNFSLIDLSRIVDNNIPVYPGDENIKVEKIKDFDKDGFSNYRYTGSMHVGTHIDGPMHLTKSDIYINDFSIDLFIGKGCLINASGMKTITCTSEFKAAILPESIVLIYTGFDKKFGAPVYFENHPLLDMDSADYLVTQRIKMLCLDTPSPDKAPYEVHKKLLQNSILIAENLTGMDKLLGVKEFEVIALPLRLHTDSSPARIVARIIK